MKRRDWWLVVLQVLMWIPFFYATLFGAVAGFSLLDTTLFLFHSVRTTGTVIAFDGVRTYSPVFTYVAVDGSTQTAHSNVGADPPDFDIGDSVPVRYETDDPSTARIATLGQTWGFAFGVQRCEFSHVACSDFLCAGE